MLCFTIRTLLYSLLQLNIRYIAVSFFVVVNIRDCCFISSFITTHYKIADKSTLVSSTKINNKTYIEEVHDEKRNLWCEVNLRRIKYRYVVLREQDIKHCGTVPM